MVGVRAIAAGIVSVTCAAFGGAGSISAPELGHHTEFDNFKSSVIRVDNDTKTVHVDVTSWIRDGKFAIHADKDKVNSSCRFSSQSGDGIVVGKNMWIKGPQNRWSKVEGTAGVDEAADFYRRIKPSDVTSFKNPEVGHYVVSMSDGSTVNTWTDDRMRIVRQDVVSSKSRVSLRQKNFDAPLSISSPR